MADALALDVTAEGVETQGQLAILKKLRCQQAQGYYLARPMPAAAMTTWLADHFAAYATRLHTESDAGADAAQPAPRTGGTPDIRRIRRV
jgi:predicted signal transduction protein with EAL and GGDEF domain